MSSSTFPTHVPHAVTDRAQTRLAPFLGAISVLVPLSVDMYLPCFPALQESFAADIGAVERSLASFFVGMLLGQLFWGPLADKLGRRLPVMAGLSLYLIGTAACFCAPSLQVLVVARAVQAFGGCAGMVIARAIVRDCFVGLRAAQTYATLTLVQGMGPILGPSIGAAVSTFVGWRGIFAVLAATAALLLWAAAHYLPETLVAPRRDLTVGRTLATYVAILADRSFMAYALTGSVMGAGMFAYISGSPFVFMELFGLSERQYGTLFAVNAVGLLLATQTNRLLARRYAPVRVLQVVTAGGALAALSLLLTSHLHPTLLGILLPLVCFLSMLGLVWPNVAACAFMNQGHRAGMAAATQGGLHWGLAFLASSATSALHNDTARPMAWVIAVTGIGGALLYALLRPRQATGA